MDRSSALPGHGAEVVEDRAVPEKLDVRAADRGDALAFPNAAEGAAGPSGVVRRREGAEISRSVGEIDHAGGHFQTVERAAEFGVDPVVDVDDDDVASSGRAVGRPIIGISPRVAVVVGIRIPQRAAGPIVHGVIID